MKRQAGKKGNKTVRISEDDLAYLASVSNRLTRSLAQQIEHIIKMHKVIMDEFRHDDVETIMADIRRWKATSDVEKKTKTQLPVHVHAH